MIDNDGDISFLKIFSELDIVPGIFTSKGAQDCDNARIRLSAKKRTEKVKKSIKAPIEDQEGATYEAGAF